MGYGHIPLSPEEKANGGAGEEIELPFVDITFPFPSLGKYQLVWVRLEQPLQVQEFDIFGSTAAN